MCLQMPRNQPPRGRLHKNREALSPSAGTENKERPHHGAPKGVLIFPKPLNQAIVEIGEPLEAMRQVSWCDVPRRPIGKARSGLVLGCPEITVVVPVFRGIVAQRHAASDNA